MTPYEAQLSLEETAAYEAGGLEARYSRQPDQRKYPQGKLRNAYLRGHEEEPYGRKDWG